MGVERGAKCVDGERGGWEKGGFSSGGARVLCWILWSGDAIAEQVARERDSGHDMNVVLDSGFAEVVQLRSGRRNMTRAVEEARIGHIQGSDG